MNEDSDQPVLTPPPPSHVNPPAESPAVRAAYDALPDKSGSKRGGR